MAASKKVLVSGGGIAGLAAAVQLKKKGWQPEVVEIADTLRPQGYTMDFFGTGWDAAERMGILDKVLGVPHPIKAFDLRNRQYGRYVHVAMPQIKKMAGGKYTYIRRPDLQQILYDEATKLGVPVRFGTSITHLDETEAAVQVTFDNGKKATYDMVVGADGIHSKVRELLFGGESQFARFLGYYIAAYQLPQHTYPVDDALVYYEETDRVAAFYPNDEGSLTALFVFRSAPLPHLSEKEILALVQKQYKGSGWVTEEVLHDKNLTGPPYFDSVTQIEMTKWHTNRTVLLGDACGCLTFMAGQGSHMALAGAYVLAEEVARHDTPQEAFAAYQAFLHPATVAKQKNARSFAAIMVPTSHSRPWLRRLVVNIAMSRFATALLSRFIGVKSVLDNYK